MSHDLEILAENRDALLLAEVAAWLHDMGKCADEHIVHQASDKPADHIYQYKTAYSHLLALAPALNLLGESISLKELVEEAEPKVVGDLHKPWLLRTLGRCHAAAHIEKESADKSGKQPRLDTRLSNAFGCEFAPLRRLTARLEGLPFSSLIKRHIFEGAVRPVFSEALGDTRRPENEVTLWDWSSIVAALYKAALAGALLGYQPEPNELRWRLLSVRVDDVAFFGHVAQIPDLLARQSLLADAFNRVCTLLEETYPLATRVYQDENSSVYVVPNLSCLLDFTNAQGTSLRDLIHTEFAQGTVKGNAQLALAGEVIPLVELDENEWWGQRPDRRKPSTDDEIPPIGAILHREVFTHADVGFAASQWTETHADICPVCGLRPQGPSKTALDHKVCDVCEHRREGRAKEWASDLTTTIWIDEVADANGRLALIVGQFDLTHWLSGDLVRTLPVPELDKILDPKKKTADKAAKNPSFARIRRVWETTKCFWEDINDKRIPNICQACPRLEFTGEFLQTGQSPRNNQAYEVTIGEYRLPVFCKDIAGSRFLSIDRLDYALKRLDLDSVAKLEEKLERGEYELGLPGEYGAKRQKIGTLRNIKVKEERLEYSPHISILAEPRIFMALVPADKALEISKAINAKYEREMGKVRNRLPLTLGAVYFGRHTPLAAAMDTGRRMINIQGHEQPWKVKAVDPPLPRTDWPTKVTLTLKQGDREISAVIPTVMGDGTTSDVWYPYWHVEDKPTDRKRWFIGPDGKHWVHVCDLKVGDKVSFTPSTFDYEYLDTSARRFEVSYKDGQRRGSDKHQRPYLLEELEQLDKVWKLIKPPQTSTSQIKALTALIESKRRYWQEPTGDQALALSDDDPFRQLCRDALANTTWRGHGWNGFSDTQKESLEGAALSGMLADALELHLTLAKESDEKEAS